jgi:hypothetical protein
VSNDEREPIPEAVGELLAALIGLLTGPAGPLIGTAVRRPLVDLAKNAWDEIRGRQAQNAGDLLGNAAEDLGTSAEDVAASAVNGGDATSQLLFESIRAATETLNAEKVEWLARALANGLRDDHAKVDVMTLVVRAIADLDPVHARVLDRLCRTDGPVRENDLVTLCGPEGLEAINAVLVRHGMVENATDFSGDFQRAVSNDARLASLSGMRGGLSNPSPIRVTNDAAWIATSFGRLCWKQIAPPEKGPAERPSPGGPTRDE